MEEGDDLALKFNRKVKKDGLSIIRVFGIKT